MFENPDRLLRGAALFYAFGLVLHTADHLRRGLDVVSTEVQWAGNLSTALGILAVICVLTGYRRAPLVAALVGFPVAVGVASVHLLPHWSAFSDAFPGAHRTGVTPLSWTVVLLEIAGALALGAAGLYAALETPRRSSTGPSRST
jgi:hypothetical protein